MAKQTKTDKRQKQIAEGRGEWWYFPWWKVIVYIATSPLMITWATLYWSSVIVSNYTKTKEGTNHKKIEL